MNPDILMALLALICAGAAAVRCFSTRDWAGILLAAGLALLAVLVLV